MERCSLSAKRHGATRDASAIRDSGTRFNCAVHQTREPFYVSEYILSSLTANPVTILISRERLFSGRLMENDRP